VGDSNTWILGTQSETRFRTTDGGVNWTKVNGGGGIQHGGGTTYYTKAGVLYASGYPTNQKSTDNGATWTNLGVGGATTAIFGDGTHLYTAPMYGPSSYLTSLETDGTTWTAVNPQQFKMGPFEMAFDAANGILYTASWNDGLWAMKIK
jgi:hypothetical protein